MVLDNAYSQIKQFPWLKPYFQTFATWNEPSDPGWLSSWLRNIVRYIATRPLKSLDLTKTGTAQYDYFVPDPQIGVEKTVDLMLFHLTSPNLCFEIQSRSGPQHAKPCGLPAGRERMTHSRVATFCYRFQQHPEEQVQFHYLESTKSMADAITEHCAKFGHYEKYPGRMEPIAVVASTMIHTHTFGTILVAFDVYPAKLDESPWQVDMSYFCTCPTHYGWNRLKPKPANQNQKTLVL